MSGFRPIEKLEVYRRLSSGQRTHVGTLAQNRQSVFFQYDSDYLGVYANLSPFGLSADSGVQQAPREPHSGLHGVFADALPDGWGLLLMDRVFRQNGIQPYQLTAMDRLAYMGSRGMGALEFEPAPKLSQLSSSAALSLGELGLEAQALYDGQTTEVLAQLANAGGSGGARPKAQIYLAPDDLSSASTIPSPGLEPWLVKFTSSSLALGHEEGMCEATYLALAQRAGIDVPEWALLPAPDASGAQAWLGVKRFDCSPVGGRYHLHSLCGLLDADFRTPSMDYEDLIKASSLLCRSPAVGQAQFRRAVFNLMALNQDDHTKNWAFLQDDQGRWQIAPFYDVTFSPSPYGEHAMSFMGFGNSPSLKAMQQLAAQANFASWSSALEVVDEVMAAIASWGEVAKDIGVSESTRQLIEKQLSETYQQNKHWISGPA